ncbi:flavodoxin family protein [Candidatus Aerophobetes bacterium]|nr:flavodoxin family protein [Candidatus Aerophobetes bacterium]
MNEIIQIQIYFGSATPPIKTFMDRVGYAAMGMKRPLEKKIGAGVVVARRVGQEAIFLSLTSVDLLFSNLPSMALF